MNLNAAALKLMVAKGLTLEDVAEIVAANEKKCDPTAAERQARCRARKQSRRDVTRDPPNESIILTPSDTPTPDGVGPKPVSEKSRGTRLPENWELPEEWAGFARTRRRWTAGDIAEEALLFANYWHSRTGAGATHRDWFKTWQNWVIRSHRKDGEVPRYTAPTDPARAHAEWSRNAEIFRAMGREDDVRRCEAHIRGLEEAHPELASKVASLIDDLTASMRVAKARAA